MSVNRSNGLPTDEVYDICQDKKGFLWLATSMGLYRYDGFSFVLWQSETQTSASGSCVRQDRYGRIWYENFDGFIYYTDGKELRSLKQKQPLAYAPFGLSDKYLFALHKGGVDIYDISSLALIHTVQINLKQLQHACYLNGAYYVVSDEMIYKVGQDRKLSSRRIPNQDGTSVVQLFASGDSLYLVPRISGEGVIYVMDGEMNVARKVPISVDGLVRGIEFIDHEMWVYTSRGCVAAGKATGGQAERLFDGRSISKIICDRTGNYWFATSNEGLFVVPDISYVQHSFDQAKISQVVATGDGILAGTRSGDLLRFQARTGVIQQLSTDKHGAEIYYLYADDRNVFYSATGHTMLSNEGKKQTKSADIAVKAVVPVDDKYYAIAASGLCLLMPMPGSVSARPSGWDSCSGYDRYRPIAGSRILLNAVRARAVAYDSSLKTIYCATNGGIVAISPAGKRQVNVDGKPVYAAGLVSYGGAIYAADTKGRILCISGTEEVEVLGNLPGSGSIRMLKMSGGRLFYISGKRLFYFTGHASVQQVTVRIDADEINDIAAADSLLWLATDNGVIEVPWAGPDEKSYRPELYINDITINGKIADSNWLRNLAFDENNIVINYSLIEYAAPAPALVRYKINNGAWVDLPANSRTLQFRSLSPGGYAIRFSVNGAEVGGLVTLNVAPPFWQQIWFYVFSVFAVLFLVLAYYSYRMKARMRNAEAQQEKIRLEERLSRSMLTALRSQMNPHFFFNALNTVQAYIFTNEKSKASDYLAKLSMLTRTILEMSETETVLLTSEVEALHLYLELERARFGDDFSYEIISGDINELAGFEIPSMIIQPFVENAVKHGLLHKEGVKRLELRFTRKENTLEVSIDDNGIGRARSEELNEIKNRKYRPYSTRATAERVKLLNVGHPDRVIVEIIDKVSVTGVAEGTTVIIRIQLT